MGVGERENVTDLGGGHSLDIAQSQDFTLCGRQGLDGFADHLSGLSGEQLVFRRPPGGGLDGPMVRSPKMGGRQNLAGEPRSPTQTRLGRRGARRRARERAQFTTMPETQVRREERRWNRFRASATPSATRPARPPRRPRDSRRARAPAEHHTAPLLDDLVESVLVSPLQPSYERIIVAMTVGRSRRFRRMHAPYRLAMFDFSDLAFWRNGSLPVMFPTQPFPRAFRWLAAFDRSRCCDPDPRWSIDHRACPLRTISCAPADR